MTLTLHNHNLIRTIYRTREAWGGRLAFRLAGCYYHRRRSARLPSPRLCFRRCCRRNCNSRCKWNYLLRNCRAATLAACFQTRARRATFFESLARQHSALLVWHSGPRRTATRTWKRQTLWQTVAIGGLVLEDHGKGWVGVLGRCIWAAGGYSAGENWVLREDWRLYKMEVSRKRLQTKILLLKPVAEAIVDTVAVAHGGLWKRLLVAGIPVRVIITISIVVSILIVLARIIHVVIHLAARVQRLVVLVVVEERVLPFEVPSA